MWKIRSDLLVRRSPFRFRGKFLLQGLCFIPDFRRSFFLNILPNHLVFQVGLLLSRFLILLYNAHNQVRRRIFLSFALILFLRSFWVIFSGFIRYSASVSTVYKNFRCNTNDEFCTSILKATLKIISTFSCRASFAWLDPRVVAGELDAKWIAKLLYRVWSRFKLADVIAGNGQWRELDLIIATRAWFVHVGVRTPGVAVSSTSLRALVRTYVRAEVPARARVHDNCHVETPTRAAFILHIYEAAFSSRYRQRWFTPSREKWLLTRNYNVLVARRDVPYLRNKTSRSLLCW